MRWMKWFRKFVTYLLLSIVGLVLILTGLLYYFKDSIIQRAIKEANLYLNTEVRISKIDLTFWESFPYITLSARKVFIKDALPKSKSTDTLLFANKVSLDFDAYEIWNKKYRLHAIHVESGTLHLKRKLNGKNNYDILKPQEETPSDTPLELQLDRIELDHISSTYSDENAALYTAAYIRHLYFKGDLNAERFVMQTSTSIQLEKLRQGKITLIKNQPIYTSLNINVDQLKNEVQLDKGILNLSGIPLNFELESTPQRIDVKLKVKELELSELVNKLSNSDLNSISTYGGTGRVAFDFRYLDNRDTESPAQISSNFSIRNGRITEPTTQLNLSDIQVIGNFRQEHGTGSETLNLDQLRFTTKAGPFSGNLAIQSFTHPDIQGNAQGTLALDVLHQLFRIPKIATIAGELELDTRFKLAENAATASIELIDGDGNLNFKQTEFQLENDQRKFKEIAGNIALNQREARLENMHIELGKSDLTLNGAFNQIDLFLQERGNLLVELDARSKAIHLSDFNPDSTVTQQTNGQKIWILPEHITGKCGLEIGSIELENHRFTEFHAALNIADKQLELTKIEGKNAGCQVNGSLYIQEIKPELFDVKTELSTGSLYFKSLFSEWNNFDQEVIKAENISGKADLKLQFGALFDLTTGIKKETIQSIIDLTIDEGKLIELSTLKELAKSLKTPQTRLILKKEEIEALESKLKLLSFDQLKNTLLIKNSTLYIPKMVLASNVLDLTIEGSHTFSNAIDYRFSFRLRDLKQPVTDGEFGEVQDDGSGVIIYVKMTGTIDNPVISWDKNARKQDAKVKREAEKKEIMSILKTEFGFRKNDTTIPIYKQKPKPETEEIQLDFGGGTKNTVPAEEEKKKKSGGKLMQSLKDKTNKLKEQQKKEKQEEFEVGP